MAEYIDREAAICIADYAADEHPYSKEPDKRETYSNYNQGWNDACDYIHKRIENTIFVTDVAPVRHGEWIIGVGNDEFDIKCSKCGWDDTFGVAGVAAVKMISKTIHYCPSCGAKMDKENKNDE